MHHALMRTVASIKINEHTKQALNFKKAVKLPSDQNISEWLFVNVNHLFDEIIAIYQKCESFCTVKSCPSMIATDKYTFLWADNENSKPINLSAREYIYKLFDWTDVQLSNLSQMHTLPESFKDSISVILRRLIRVFAHVYCQHSDKLALMGIDQDLNAVFQHTIYFIKEFQLVDANDLAPIQTFVAKLCP